MRNIKFLGFLLIGGTSIIPSTIVACGWSAQEKKVENLKMINDYVENLSNRFETNQKELTIDELGIKVGKLIDSKTLGINLPKIPWEFNVQLLIKEITYPKRGDLEKGKVEIELKLSNEHASNSKTIIVSGFNDAYTILENYVDNLNQKPKTDKTSLTTQDIFNTYQEKNQNITLEELGIDLPEKSPKQIEIESIKINSFDQYEGQIVVTVKFSRQSLANKEAKIKFQTFTIYGYKRIYPSNLVENYINNLSDHFETNQKKLTIDELDIKVGKLIDSETLGILLPETQLELKIIVKNIIYPQYLIDQKGKIIVEVVVSKDDYFKTKTITISGFIDSHQILENFIDSLENKYQTDKKDLTTQDIWNIYYQNKNNVTLEDLGIVLSKKLPEQIEIEIIEIISHDQEEGSIVIEIVFLRKNLVNKSDNRSNKKQITIWDFKKIDSI